MRSVVAICDATHFWRRDELDLSHHCSRLRDTLIRHLSCTFAFSCATSVLICSSGCFVFCRDTLTQDQFTKPYSGRRIDEGAPVTAEPARYQHHKRRFPFEIGEQVCCSLNHRQCKSNESTGGFFADAFHTHSLRGQAFSGLDALTNNPSCSLPDSNA